jgi:hypothetical protein
VNGDWIASSIAAGALPGPNGYGTGDTKMSGPGVSDDPNVISKIASLTIGGEALGTVGGTDSYGVVAENVQTIKIVGTKIPTAAGNSTDDFFVGITGDFKVHEI